MVQFELIAELNAWDQVQKALYLAASLKGQARAILSDLDSTHRRDYSQLSAALSNRFSPANQTQLFRAMLKNRARKPDESIPQLAQEIKRLTLQAYPEAPYETIETLARDYFIDSLGDTDTKWRVYQSRPRNLSDAVVVAVELESFFLAETKKGNLRRPIARAVVPPANDGEFSVRGYGIIDNDSGIRVDGLLQEVPVNFLVDTGANITIINPRVYTSIPKSKQPKLLPAPVKMLLADGSVFPFQGRGVFQVCIAGRTVEHDVWVAEIGLDAILGLDFLRKHQCHLDILGGIISWDQVRLGEPQVDREQPDYQVLEPCRVILCETVVIAPGTESVIRGEISGKFKGNQGLVEPAEKFVSRHGLLVGKLLVNPENLVVPLRVFNPSFEPIRVYKGTVAGVLEEVAEVVGMEGSSNGNQATPVRTVNTAADEGQGTDEVPHHLVGLLDSCGNRLEKEQYRQLKELLIQYGDVFSMSSSDLGRTTVVKHAIDTGSAKPIKQPARRVPVQQRQVERDLVKEMLTTGVIEPSASAWSSPVVLVKKKNGKTRFCIDYRKVNAVTSKDSYPIPRITDSLDALSGAQWFTTLDLASGYWQVGMDESDKEKTAFVTGEGLFQFRVMPFGLCNAPATFERLMDRVLSGLHWQVCLVYLDDVIVYGSTFEESLGRLKEVLGRLRAANLKLSPEKCNLFQPSVTYLGYVVSKKGVATDPQKVTDVKDWPRPQNLTDVRSFLGLCGYYRRFIEGFADIAAPLFKLTEKKQTFDWDTDCETAVQRLKEALTSAPVLAYPNSCGRFILDTDASDFGVGAVLSQIQDGEEKVVSYFSKAMTKQEKRYCVTRKELLAVVKAVKQFHHYLYGTNFLIRTDHAALRWLMAFRNPEGQIARWLELLSTYQFDIQHRPGKSHGNADGLSRRPCGRDCNHCNRKEMPGKETEERPLSFPTHSKVNERSKGEQRNSPKNSVLPQDTLVAAVTREKQEVNDPPWLQEWSLEAIREEQLKDVETRKIIEWKEESEVRPEAEEIARENKELKNYWAQWERLEIRDGVLCRRWESHDGREISWQLVVPRGLRTKILELLHDNPTVGHMGIKRTVQRVQKRFYWHGWRRQVEWWCKACIVCQERRTPKTKGKASMKVERVGAPLERIAIDILGPLPVTDRGNKYIMVVA
ncbi:hypothetical protein HOLleu_23675 [Holothuria leucospilota]|uniref:Reverse transcriptase n=1 Tax=Holothuria leucospilota TaxID=206669 RepID=A0A9Q1BV70_HOLLE|nr:hypothetical protein HOLleu_23675 [Holothuria leucospilota]